MKPKGLKEEQIIGVLRAAEAGAETSDLAPKRGVSAELGRSRQHENRPVSG